MTRNEILYDYLFWYNPYSNISHAIKRGNGNWEKCINGEKFDGLSIKGNDFKSLQNLLVNQK